MWRPELQLLSLLCVCVLSLENKQPGIQGFCNGPGDIFCPYTHTLKGRSHVLEGCLFSFPENIHCPASIARGQKVKYLYFLKSSKGQLGRWFWGHLNP